MAPRNDCHLPAGREDAILNCLPVIPRPIFERFQATGKFPAGMQKALDDTAACPYVPLMAQVRLSAVCVDDVIIFLSTPILGLLPPGWYRKIVSTTPVPLADPMDVLIRFRDAALTGRRVLTPDVTVRPIPQLSTTTPPPAPVPPPVVDPPPECPIPVPPVEVAIPFPFNTGYLPWPDWTRPGMVVYQQAMPGDLGQQVWRIPDPSHPLWSTGYGLQYLCHEFLTLRGLSWLSQWTEARRRGLFAPNDPRFNLGREVLRLVPLFAGESGGSGASGGLPWVDPYWYTRAFAASHIQPCTANYFGRGGAYQEAGVEGRAHRRRWRIGGNRPAAFSGASYDVLEEEFSLVGSFLTSRRTLRVGAWAPPSPPLYDANGQRRELLVPEMAAMGGMAYGEDATPIVFRDAWDRGTQIAGDRWAGAPPGAYLVTA